MRVSGFFFCLAAWMIFPAVFAAAGEIRIGWVDMPRLFAEYPGVKAAQIRYEAVAREKERQLNQEEKGIQDEREAYARKRPQMSEAKRKAAEKELRRKIDAFSEKKAAYLGEMKAREEEMSKSLVEEIRAIVARVAEKKKIDLVMDKEKVVYAHNAVDLTPDVLEQFKSMGEKAEP